MLFKRRIELLYSYVLDQWFEAVSYCVFMFKDVWAANQGEQSSCFFVGVDGK